MIAVLLYTLTTLRSRRYNTFTSVFTAQQTRYEFLYLMHTLQPIPTTRETNDTRYSLPFIIINPPACIDGVTISIDMILLPRTDHEE